MLTPLPADKATHAIAGALAYLAGAVLCALVSPDANRIIAGVSGAAGAGILKESADWILNTLATMRGQPPAHGVELADALWTLGGGVVVALGALVGA